MMIPAPNRHLDPSFYYPYRSKLPAIWSDISNAIQRFKDQCTTRVVLDELLGLELSNFGRLLKLKPGVGDEHQLVKQLANNLWTDYVRDERGNLVRRNALSTEEELKAMALTIKPHTNLRLYLSPRLCALGIGCFRSCTGSGERDLPILTKNIRRNGAGRGDDVGTYAGG